MQILEILNNLFTKDLQIHSSFLSYLFLISCEFKKNQKLMPICTNLNLNIPNGRDFKKLFSPDFLEFTLVFFYIFVP
jgi:hypothetical protein